MRILIADDHELIRRGVRSLLQRRADFEVCGEASDGQDAVRQALSLNPDLVVMDITMPKLNGLEATREIQRSMPRIGVLVLSQHDSPEMIRQALHAGARGYVVKSAIATNLIQGIDKIGRGELFFGPVAGGGARPQAGPQEVLERSQSFERELRESEERFRLTFEQAAVGVAHVSPDGRWLRVNRKMCEIAGYPQEELLKLTFQAVTHPADLAADAGQASRVIRGEIDQYEMEKRYVRRDGANVWVHLTVSGVRDAQRNLKYFIAVVEDISARKRDEQSANLLAAIVDSSDDAIVSKGLDGIITSWNRGAERLFGYTAEEAIGNPIGMIVPPDRQQEETDVLARMRRGERVDQFETVRMRKDGTCLDISVTISPLKDGAGRVVGASKVARDISERKRNLERLRALTERLDAEVRARTKELEERNADVLRQSEQLRQLSWRLLRAEDEERRHIARELHDSAGQTLAVLAMNLSSINVAALPGESQLAEKVERAQNLVSQLTREIRTTSYLLHPPLLDETGLPAALSWYVRGLAERSGLDLTLDVAEHFGRLSNDLELAIFRLVQESLTNVHRHSGSKRASIKVARLGGQVLVEIRDEGKGISPGRLAEIQSGGSGVGIRGMRERLRQFHGELAVESSGRGTIILVTIPFAEPAPQARPATV